MKIRAFITHKLKENYSECQDRFCINSDSHTIAVSDGMSQSVFPDYWAEILSSFYAKNGHCTDEDRKELCNVWLNKVVDFISTEIHNGKNPWRLQNCIEAQNGAGATLCGVKFFDAENWAGHVLGDSCIIEVDITRKEPINILSSESKTFDSYPDYYESFPNKVGRGQIKEFSGKLSEGHCLLLVSDPFSEFLSNHKGNCSQWLSRILELKGHEEYCSLVDDWRQEGLHNDDSTLCIIEPDGSVDFNIELGDDIYSLMESEKTPEVSNKSLQTKENSVTTVLSDEEKKEVKANISSKQGNTAESSTLEDIKQKSKQDFEEYASNCCESIIDKAKQHNSYPTNRKKQVTRSSSIGANDVRRFCNELVDKYKECIDKFFQMLIKE